MSTDRITIIVKNLRLLLNQLKLEIDPENKFYLEIVSSVETLLNSLLEEILKAK